MNPSAPLVLHIPHASKVIPPDVRRSVLLSNSELETELNKLTDAFTDELFSIDTLKASSVVFPVSRIVLDPERFLDDDQEIMARIGMGVIYTRTSDGEVLRHPPNKEERGALIEKYYYPHHKKFEACVHSCLITFERCTIIDCHSFPSKPLPIDLDQSEPRPDICIGTDAFHTPDWLTHFLCDQFEHFGWSTMINTPYAGTIVPMRYYEKDHAVRSVMIEVNRKLYMDEHKGIRNTEFNTVKQRVAQVLQTVVSAGTV